MTWQPIETAPKDGTEVLLSEKYCNTPVVAYWANYGVGRGGKWHACFEHYTTSGCDSIVDILCQELITHWMPLPAPPSYD